MAIIFKDRCKVTEVSVSGTSGFSVSFATSPAGFQSVPVPTGPDLVPLLIQNDSVLTEWEVGLYSADGLGISRGAGSDRVLASSNSGSPVNFTAGSDKTVALVNPAFFVDSLNLNYTNTSSPVQLQSLFGVDIPSAYSAFPSVSRADHVRGVYCPGGGHIEASAHRLQTTDATATVAETVVLGSTSAVLVAVGAVALQSSGSAPFPSKHVTTTVAAVNNGSSTAVVGTPTITVVGEDAALSSADVSVAASGSSIQISVTGLASTTLEWIVKTSVTYIE